MGALAATVLVRARASETEGQGAEGARTFLGLPLVMWQWLNLALFLFVLVKLLRKPLAAWVGERRNNVARELKESEEKRARTEALAKELQERLSRIETELAELRTHSEKEAAAEQAALTVQTEQDAQRIVQRATAEIDSRVRSARKELTAYAGDLALEIAADVLKKNLTPEDQARLLREGTDSLARAGKG
jgi:F-type H+-transporting ATPase subunit b